MNVRGMMSISLYVHMIIVVKIEGEDEHSKVLDFFKCASYMLHAGMSFCTVPADRPHPHPNKFIFFCTPRQLVKLHLSVTKEC